MATNFVPSGAGISVPWWKPEVPPVGDFLGPNGELILVYPGSGHKKPSGLKPSISLFDESTELMLLFWIIGIKNIDINIENKIIMNRIFLNKFVI